MTTLPSRRDLMMGRFAEQSFHIASLLVQARPERIPALTGSLNEIAGIEVHDSDARGRMVISVEAENDSGLLAAITRIEQTDGVITTSLVYHQIEDDGDE